PAVCREGTLTCAVVAQLEGVATRMIDVETLVRMFDDRNCKSSPAKFSDKICHQCRLTGVLPANHAKKRRPHRSCSFSSASALASSSGSLMLKKGSIGAPPISALEK